MLTYNRRIRFAFVNHLASQSFSGVHISQKCFWSLVKLSITSVGSWFNLHFISSNLTTDLILSSSSFSIIAWPIEGFGKWPFEVVTFRITPLLHPVWTAVPSAPMPPRDSYDSVVDTILIISLVVQSLSTSCFEMFRQTLPGVPTTSCVLV